MRSYWHLRKCLIKKICKHCVLTLIYWYYWFVVCVSPAQVQDLMYLKSPFPNIHAHTSILNYYYISSRHIYSERSLLIETRMWKTNIYCTTLQIHERINGHSTKYIISCNVKVFSRKKSVCMNSVDTDWHDGVLNEKVGI